MGDRTKITRLTVAICAIGSFAACGDEPPPTSVMEFMENPVLLDATMVRCVQNRERTKYDPECLNARDAADRLAVTAEEARREELEVQSERKRLALRQAQEVADERRRRASELKRLREEAVYLGLVESDPEDEDEAGVVTVSDLNLPNEAMPANPAGSTPAADSPPGPVDLEAVREELQQREEEPPHPTLN